MTKDDWTEDEWAEEELEAEAPASRRAGLRAARWRPLAYGAAAGALLLAVVAAMGAGGAPEGGAERPLSPARSAVFAPSPAAFREPPPARPFPGDALETGDIPPQAALRLPPPPAFVAPGDWGDLETSSGPPPATGPRGPVEAPIEVGGLAAPGRAAAQNLEALRLDAEMIAPPGAFSVSDPPAMETDSGPPPPSTAAPAAPATPAAGLPPIRDAAPPETPAPRPKPRDWERAAATPPNPPKDPPKDPDVYSPPREAPRTEPAESAEAAPVAPPGPEAAPAAAAPRKGWGARVELEAKAEIRVAAAAADPPIHDPAPKAASGASGVAAARMGPVYEPRDAGGPTHDPAARRPSASGAGKAPMISASVAFGPELSPEEFAALDLSPDALETGDLPRVRVAPIDSPDDGPFSVRSETPSAPAPRRRSASGPALPKDAPRATVVLTALGLHEATTLRAIRDAPDEVALAFAPIGRRVEARVADLRSQGRAALIEAPMEAMSRASTPEELTLSTSVGAAENQARLNRVLAIAPQASGISTYMGARFTADSGALAGVLPILAQRGLIVLENQPTNRSLLREAARSAGVRYAAAPVVLDRERDAASIRSALARLERQALADGEALGVMAVSSEALDALALWTEGLASRGVRLAPLGEALE